jgi:6-pyruvoyltetrahydropterin/6-carboxytetrahydropterin synthase
MPTSLTRVVRFHASHHLWVTAWDEAENRRRFGTLTEPHGHDYECSVTVGGTTDPQGMVVDLALLDQILEEEVRRPLEGRHLNRDLLTFAQGRPLPTCEALAEFLFEQVRRRLPAGVRLERLRVAEDQTLHADRTAVE